MASKFIIYQLLLRVFGNTNEECISGGSLHLNGTGKFSSVTDIVLQKLKQLAVTHVWYTGVIEHATKSSFEKYGIKKDDVSVIKGEAGSPYAIKDYYDVNPYLADSVQDRMAEFCALVERTHRSDLKVIIDFVPNHLARGYNSDSTPEGIKHFGEGDDLSLAFSPQNNYYYLPGQKLDLSEITNREAKRDNQCVVKGDFYEFPAKATGNDCFCAKPGRDDWYETVKLNYGVDYFNGRGNFFEPRPKTWDMMLDVLRFWASKGIDGFRCDMAEMVPVEFWSWAIGKIKREFPHIIFIAEVYNPSLYSSYLYNGNFDYLYDKVGLYDNLKVITQRFVGKAAWFSSASSITNNWQLLGNRQYSMLNFLENHDEQRVASDFNIGDPFRAIPELAVSLMLNTAPFMIYFGQEFGERGMLSEGFSGLDGRTSIFDYCSAPSVARWLGGLDSQYKSRLTDKERELYRVYIKLFNIAMGEKAIRDGAMYDLEYANFQTDGFNPDDHFVFARKADGDLILVAVDFSQAASSLNVKVPLHMLEFFCINADRYKAKNLLCDDEKTEEYPLFISLNGYEEVNILLNDYGVGILKIINVG